MVKDSVGRLPFSACCFFLVVVDLCFLCFVGQAVLGSFFVAKLNSLLG